MDGWVWERTPQDAVLAASRFAAEGLRLVTVRQPEPAGLEETQAAIAEALHLPPPAGHDLHAFADASADLRRWWSGEAVALLWEDAWRLREADPRAWRLLTTILDEAHVPTVAVIREEPGADPGTARIGV